MSENECSRRGFFHRSSVRRNQTVNDFLSATCSTHHHHHRRVRHLAVREKEQLRVHVCRLRRQREIFTIIARVEFFTLIESRSLSSRADAPERRVRLIYRANVTLEEAIYSAGITFIARIGNR